MSAPHRDIGQLIARVRARWRQVIVLRAAVVAALAVAAVLAAGWLAGYGTARSSHGLAAVGVVTAVLALAAAWRAMSPARQAPSDLQVARFIEERDPSLDDRLVSAVDVAAKGTGAMPALATAMLADAERRAARVEPAAVIAPRVLRRSAVSALAAVALLCAVGFTGRHVARRSFDALSLTLFPARVHLDVVPGDARVQAGASVTIEARLAGNTAPVSAQLQRWDGEGWISGDMPAAADGAFRVTFDGLGESFRYRVVAGAIASDAYEIAVVRPPRVTRVDVEYRYPAALGLAPRVEEDAGDVYAPAGTDVRLMIHTDRDAASGEMTRAGGGPLPLTAATATRLDVSFRVEGDDSYRLRVADREGMAAPGETEYFIRMLDDRPPEVRVLRPARDRSVTPLEEVDVQAEAQDDFGVAALELVYSVRGGAERVLAFDVPARAVTARGTRTLFLEDLRVKAGDFISYYVRARDVPRGRRASEARSDMFFLEVKPFEQQFSLAQSQGGGAGGGSPQIDDLVNAQKEIIVATWKLDRRSVASGASSASDIRAVAKAEAELKVRAEATASQFRDSTMRDPRRRGPSPGGLRAGQTLPEEDAMTAASKAMARAVSALETLKTKPALPPELEALNHLLDAQAQVTERQITRQTGAGGAGQNRQAQDLSSLFDKELARQQQTNYETPAGAESEEASDADRLLERIRELARRQDELLRRQDELARQRPQMSDEQVKRALETLTREQQRLKEQAEQMARQMSRGQAGRDSQDSSARPQTGAAPRDRQGDQTQGGQPRQSGASQSQGSQQAGSTGQTGQPGQSGQPRQGDQSGRTGDRGARMREVSEEMQRAAGELGRQDPTQAAARGGRALDALRDLERQLQAGRPDDQRRAVGDMQLEARQLADAQRQLSSELGRVGQGETGRDALRRLAGEQERLADRAERLRRSLQRQADAGAPSERGGTTGGRTGGGGEEQTAGARRAVGEAAREMQRQRIAERMEQSAQQLRGAAGATGQQPGGDRQGSRAQESDAAPAGSPTQVARATAGGQEEIARSLDRLADRLSAASGPADDESRQLTDRLARAQELRERMERLSREMETLDRQARRQGTQPGGDASGKAAGGKSNGNGDRQPSAARGGDQPGGGDAEGPGAGSDETGRLRDEYARQLEATQNLLDELRRDERANGAGGRGFTFEGQGMVLSAPGTQAFKQDFARWEELRRQATQALERAETDLSKRLDVKRASDRLASGVDDRAPAAYRQQVDSYFKALAAKKGR